MANRGSRAQYDRDYIGHVSPSAQGSVAPGKQTLTARITPTPASTAPAQCQIDASQRVAQLKREANMQQWMDVLMRPDLYEPPADQQDELPTDGGGRPMPNDVRSKMENAFGVDFSAVRIHEGPRAPALGARAYAQGTAFGEVVLGSQPDATSSTSPGPTTTAQSKRSDSDRSGTDSQRHPSDNALPEDIRAKMETAFGAKFTDVRVRTSSSTPEAIGADALAQGNEIHFAPGKYDPTSQGGQELIGHELAHVIQQRQGRVSATAQASGLAINDDSALEREADEMGARAARGEAISLDAPTVQLPATGVAQGGKKKEPGQSSGSSGSSGSSESESEKKNRKRKRNPQDSSGKSEHPRKRRKIEDNSQEQDSVEDDLDEDDDPVVLRLMQFGGGRGSYAGDAFLMSAQGSRRLHGIDFGQEGSAQNQAARDAFNDEDYFKDSASSDWESFEDEPTYLSENADSVYANWEKRSSPDRARARRTALLTHRHADHSGGSFDQERFGTVYYGQSGGLASDDENGVYIESSENNILLHSWKHKDHDISVEGRVIRPPDVGLNKKEERKAIDQYANKLSMGELIVIRTPAGTTRWLSLGDMEEHGDNVAVRQSIADVCNSVTDDSVGDADQPSNSREDDSGGGEPMCEAVDFLKVPHHGSGNNVDVIPEGAIDENTTLLISGYSESVPHKLINKINSAKRAYLLLESEEKLKELLKKNQRRIESLLRKVTVCSKFELDIHSSGKVKPNPTIPRWAKRANTHFDSDQRAQSGRSKRVQEVRIRRLHRDRERDNGDRRSS